MSDTFHIVCPACDRINRLPRAKPGQMAKCGQCGASLFPGKPIELGGERFKRHVARNDIPVVVDFWAPWCGPCRAMAPVFEQVAQELEPAARFFKVNVDAEPGLAEELGIQGIPALFVFRNGQVTSKKAGMMNQATLRRWIAEASRQ
ncbi:thioredoxin TrxC [Microvirga arabica]|uniref:thioredoxin TrxC n=1 Tax=Microvirga arabica TaxID=1128671 RepID=UPI00193A7E0E|nr:thioredoxin TrxC [Microvirga arabica]MBM1174402.1 thioredoxin TrxC [Microvirga arabica]